MFNDWVSGQVAFAPLCIHVLLNLFYLIKAQKATEVTEEPLPARNNSNIKWNTSNNFSFVYVTRKK
jgi:hypothetical protein